MTAISLNDTAAIVGLSPDRFRKVWRTWHEGVGFPAPFRGGIGRAGYAWDREDVEAWKASRKSAVGHHRPQRAPGGPRINRAERARAALARLRGEVDA